MWWVELETRRELAHGTSDGEVHASAVIEAGAVIDQRLGPVTIGAKSRICAGAMIKGPVTIGDQCMIGNLALIRGPTLIGNRVAIGFAAEVKAAVIEDDVAIGPQCFIADSLIEHGAYLGAQVRTSNHRLDQQSVGVFAAGKLVDSGREKLGCRIGAMAALGIQVIVLPGREIAAGATFAPRITVERNLPTGRYRLTQTLESF
jgi:bifunctional UDP-N-acetylglucosamine pyrophosphorylase/glucosamine-1-phosphate N-acetyltransferase